MITTKNFAAIALAACLFGAGTACQKVGNSNNAVNQAGNTTMTNSAANANAANTSANGTTGSTAASGQLGEVYKAAYTARKNKDVEGLKKLMSKDVLQFLTMMGGADDKKKKSLDDMLKELCERPQAATIESRNEKIDGDTGTIEYLDESGGWSSMDFVKEDGVWKLTIAKGGPDGPGGADDDEGDVVPGPDKKTGNSNK